MSELAALQRAFAANIRNPDRAPCAGLDKQRMGIYQELFYNNIEGFLAGCYPVLKEVLLQLGQWEKLTRLFLAEHACKTPYFLKICEEFLEYLRVARLPFTLPEYATHLAHWEWMELFADIYDGEEPPAAYNGDMLCSAVVITPLAWLCCYPYAVHSISAQQHKAEHSDTFLLIYRHADKVGFCELNALSATLFRVLQNNSERKALSALLAEIAADSGLDTCIVQQGGLKIIEQWQALGIVRQTLEAAGSDVKCSG